MLRSLTVFLVIIYFATATVPDLVINELNLDDNFIEVRNVGSTPIDVSELLFYSYRVGNNNRESLVSLGSGSIPVNGIVRYGINGGSRKKRSNGGSIAFNVGTDGSRLVLIYENNNAEVDRLIFKVTAGADETAFNSRAPEWSNKYLMWESGKTFVRCGDNSMTPEDWRIVDGGGTPDAPNDCNSGAGGDPHFTQKVIDFNTNVTHNLCYDITGKSGDSLQILKDELTHTQINGILMNDYYMHTIQVIHKDTVYSFKTNFIELDKERILPWTNNQFSSNDGNVHFVINNNKIFIKIKFGESHSLDFLVVKSLNSVVGNYLDVEFKDINMRDKRYSGIIGFIGKQKLSLIKPVQNQDYGVIKLSNKGILAEKQIRQGKECWLVKFEEVIQPKQRKDFIK